MSVVVDRSRIRARGGERNVRVVVITTRWIFHGTFQYEMIILKDGGQSVNHLTSNGIRTVISIIMIHVCRRRRRIVGNDPFPWSTIKSGRIPWIMMDNGAIVHKKATRFFWIGCRSRTSASSSFTFFPLHLLWPCRIARHVCRKEFIPDHSQFCNEPLVQVLGVVDLTILLYQILISFLPSCDVL